MTAYLLAHGSADPRHAEDVEIIAERLAAALGEDVRPCYLDLCPPTLSEVADTPGVVVPLLFSPGYHVKVDVGEAVAAADVDLVVADPPLLTSGAGWGCELLSEVRQAWPDHEVVFVTAGSRDAEVLRLWDLTAEALGVAVMHASGPGRRFACGPRRTVVVPLLVARGSFSDRIEQDAAQLGAAVAALAGTSRALIGRLSRSIATARAHRPG